MPKVNIPSRGPPTIPYRLSAAWNTENTQIIETIADHFTSDLGSKTGQVSPVNMNLNMHQYKISGTLFPCGGRNFPCKGDFSVGKLLMHITLIIFKIGNTVFYLPICIEHSHQRMVPTRVYRQSRIKGSSWYYMAMICEKTISGKILSKKCVFDRLQRSKEVKFPTKLLFF